MKQPNISLVALVTSLATALGACTSSPSPSTTGPTIAASADASPNTTGGTVPDVEVTATPAKAGPAPRLFTVSLSEGVLPRVPSSTTTITEGNELDPQRVTELIAKLPKWDDPSALTTPFQWPIQSTPRPRAGKTVNEVFPPASGPDAPTTDNGALKVLRVQPEGNVPIAPYVAVTFNQPMVPVGTVAQLTPAESLVRLTPNVPGRWQWIGTRTLRFDIDPAAKVDRLPMATTFNATVPAGTKSATGASLATETAFSFTTPAPVVESFSPTGESLKLEPLFVASFDQRIDPATVLQTLRLKANGTDVPVRLATKDEVAADESAKGAVANAQEGRFVAFRPVNKLSTRASLVIEFAVGTASAEGPNKTRGPQSFTGRTYGPLDIVALRCNWGDECYPGTGLFVEFTNSLDPNAAGSKNAGVLVEPKLPGQTVRIDGGVSIEGATKARTTYTITLPAGLTDVFGQTLGKSVRKTITIGKARPSLRALEAITTLDPFSKSLKLSMLTTNQAQVRVRVFEADPAKFGEYLRYLERRDDPAVKLPAWRELADTMVTPKTDNDATVETSLDLSGPLREKPGQVIVLVEPVPARDPRHDDYWEHRPILTWVQSTTMALDGFASGDSARLWATDLRNGSPLEGITVTSSVGANAQTDQSGVATLPLSSRSVEPSFYSATKGAETFILPANFYPTKVSSALRWFAFDDRQIYRPGEKVSVKGWVRLVDGNTGALTIGRSRRASYAMTDANGIEIAKGSMTIGALGGFDFSAPIPETANVGPASLQFMAEGESEDFSAGQHSFQIAEFRRPEFEVKVEPVTATAFVSTAPVTMSAKASYYAGGPLPNAPIEWAVSTSETTFSPVGWDDFTFGIFRPWWLFDSFEGGSVARSGPFPGGAQQVKQYKSTTDADGLRALQLDFTGENGVLPDLPVSVNVAGTVTDVNRQAWADQQDILVHSADQYVGLRSDRSFVRQGDPLNVEAIATDIDGKAVSGTKLELAAGLLRSDYINGKFVETVVDPQTCTITTAAEPAKCEFTTPVGGQYRITTTITDAKGGRNRTELSVWVSGAETIPARNVEQEALTLIPDKKEYAAGDTAKVLVQAPFANGEGLLVIAHGTGIRETRRFSAQDASAEIEITISEADVPNVSLSIEVVGNADRVGLDGKTVTNAPKRPAYAVGGLRLAVPPRQRTLQVKATPAATELEPGGKTTIEVSVHSASGAPVKDAEFAVVVVDEAVLGLTGYKLANPIEFFYAGGYDSLSTAFGRQQVRLVDPDTLASSNPSGEKRDGPLYTGGVDGAVQDSGAASADTVTAAPAPAEKLQSERSAVKDQSSGAPLQIRSKFDALALFQPTVMTDASGKATVEVTLPDSLTRYRVMVVATSGAERFGTGESNITARLPLSVRPSAPRFLNTGDEFELPVVLQNLAKTPMSVDVVIQTANLDATGPISRKVTVAAGNRIEIRFPAKVRSAGTARVRVSAFGDTESDSTEVSIPVFTPATAEAFATYGTVDSGGIRQPLLAPEDVIDSFGGLDISTSSTSLQALTDALLYVDRYNYDSSDAYASRIMSISALRGVLKDFATGELPSEAELNAAVERDVASLVGLQNDDGGWSYWRRYDRTEPFNTVQATHALVLAKQAGYAVPVGALERALTALGDIERFIPAYYGEQSRDTVRAYALWTRALSGQRDPGKAAAMFAERGEKLNLDALAWIWGSLDTPTAKMTVERTITNRAVDTAGAVSFTNDYDDADYVTLNSDRRTDALILDSLIANAPKSDLVEKVVAGLLAHKTKGRWNNAQENTFALLAFKHYYDTYESVTPNFVARAWVGNQFAGEHSFKGRTTERSNISIPMKALLAGGDQDLLVAKDGAGRLYYRIGLRYVPADLKLKALDRGFVVDRVYEGVDNKTDVTRDADGTWRIRAGAKVRVKLTLVAESQRTHVALIDPLPAGLEALNPALAVTQPIVDREGDAEQPKRSWWWGTWWDFQQFRDDRSEAFSTLLPAGVYSYNYIARATTPGSFIVPPTRAEEMYAPETFGRTSSDRVIVVS